MNQVTPIETADRPVTIPVEAYQSEAYARAENDKLWGKVWQMACRVEELPEVGDYVTYDILDESILIVRSAPDKIGAFYNVCQHRGRRLVDGESSGNVTKFRCRFHGWAWGLDGKNTFVLDPEDWGECLTAENLKLPEVKIDIWGGWIWINLDPNCISLRDYLEPAVSMLSPLKLENQRYKWRKRTRYPANWKVVIEAFNESYHVEGSHPELAAMGSTRWWCKADNNCAWHGRGPGRGEVIKGGKWSLGGILATPDKDPRVVAATRHQYYADALNAGTTQTFLNAAYRLEDELPEGMPVEEISAHFIASVVRDDAARGVVWPDVSSEQLAELGHDWHIFPNTVFLAAQTFVLAYRARPDGYNPDSCIFETYALELYPEGQEPKTEWVCAEATEENYLRILSQDFGNMDQVQKGMKSRGFKGPRPSPLQELSVIHFHRLLAKYMGIGAPVPIT